MIYERLAAVLVLALEVYAALGLVFALAFASFGVQKIDPEAKGTKVGFRLLIIPGVVAFWPMLLRRWLSGATEPPLEAEGAASMIQPLRAFHRWAFLILALVLPVVFVAGLAARRKAPPPKLEAMLLATPSGSGKKFSYPILIWSDFPKARLVAIKPLALPDALVYWSNQAPGQSALPVDSIFLGRLDPAITYQVPDPAPGFFVIYSPARKAVLDYAAFGARR